LTECGLAPTKLDLGSGLLNLILI